ncbi:MAG: hypothetical protein DKM50_08570 [Candidatus Margulisiibacteriota bacterium]|nr:MAG: hypothetical protein A2X43_11875 [Candidatus Margulisbacteria bacterium GWD2_39_127]OGI01837.1 MAG: hypothetical protein A2X42_04400 [Candidatus Margulisbacteria bacterium GWF2_38_17]OGI10159.1 MAG: hypothetical protein A2X41_01120 [Candidatus Margulisbacteria bacterium GWE2_39_32]PZM79504.1 MAG: hypothetical protein DKM50_08570 [Candidatus Margulisiibacteriota bacterium]HAR63825.1 hypothetical protein [Candidatus Margulisiibacteriota bacterium]
MEVGHALLRGYRDVGKPTQLFPGEKYEYISNGTVSATEYVGNGSKLVSVNAASLNGKNESSLSVTTADYSSTAVMLNFMDGLKSQDYKGAEASFITITKPQKNHYAKPVSLFIYQTSSNPIKSEISSQYRTHIDE